MMTDCVALEIYFGEKLRPRAFDVVAFGTVMVNRALALGVVGTLGVDGDVVAIGAAVLNASGEDAPPPEQLHSAIIAAQERMRLCMDVLLSGALT
jgi:hypothetical protein